VWQSTSVGFVIVDSMPAVALVDTAGTF
jgi:hypothetical protein